MIDFSLVDLGSLGLLVISVKLLCLVLSNFENLKEETVRKEIQGYPAKWETVEIWVIMGKNL